MKYWKVLGAAVIGVIILCLLVLFFSSCSSRHIQKSVVHTDSLVVKKADSSHLVKSTDTKKNNTGKTTVKTDKSKAKEVVKEKTVIEFDSMPSVGFNGSAEDFTNGINEDAWSNMQKRIKKITHTKTTTKAVESDKKDSSSLFDNTVRVVEKVDSFDSNKTDSTRVTADEKQVEKKVWRFSWWWLLLLLVLAFLYYKRFKI
jgi:hypothetical protein